MKTKKRFLSILLSLALVLGLMPGMSLTAYAGSPSTYSIKLNSWSFGELECVSDATLPFTFTGQDVFNLYELGEYWTASSVSLTSGSNISVSGLNITVNDEGSSTIEVYDNRSSLSFGVSVTKNVAHTHNFIYAGNGATITATCSADGCTLPPSTDGGSDHVAALTIVAPTLNTYGETGKSAAATLTGLEAFNAATSLNVAATDIKYVGRDGTTYAESATAPTNAGKYTAKITVEGATASVNYTISVPVTDVALDPGEATVAIGDTQKLTATISPENATDKRVIWKANGDDGKVAFYSDETCTMPVNQETATDLLTVYIKGVSLSSNSGLKIDVDSVSTLGKHASCYVKVGKANAVAATVTANNRTYDGTENALVTVDNSTLVGGVMRYALGTDATTAPDAYTFDTTSIPTATSAGTYYVWYKAAGDENHLDSEAACVEVTIKPAPEPAKRAAITSVSKPADVTYTGKAVKPSVTVKAGSKVLKAGTDYAVTYKNNTNVGTATVTVTGKGGYEGTKSVTFKVKPAAITSVSKPADVTYTGKAVKPKVTVKAGSKVLKAGTDYTVSYKNNVAVGTATVTAKGKGNYAGSKSATFKVKPAAITSVSRPADATYTGKAIKPPVTVKAGSKVLKAGTDYTVSYKNNVEVGTATVTARGRGNYAGTKSATFRIKAAAKPQPAKEPVAACSAYAVGLGWLSASGGSACGTTGQNRRVEALSLRLADAPVAGGIEYRVHVQDQGWQRSWSRDGQRAGRAGGGKRVEAVRIRLTGKMAEQYDVYYRVHSQTYGWLAWARNGEAAGTAARLKRLESVQVAIVRKGSKAPGRTYKGVTSKQARAFIEG